jgi:hypothetical protein
MWLVLVVLRRRSLLALGWRLLLIRLLVLLIVLLLLVLLVWVLSSTVVRRLLLVARLLIAWRRLSCLALALPLLLLKRVPSVLPSSRVARLACDVGRAEGWQSQTALPG